MKNKKNVGGGITDSLAVCLLFSFMVFIFAPIEIFLSNREQFWFSIYDMIPFALLGFVFSLLGILIFLLIVKNISGKAFHGAIVFLSAITLGLYIQGNFVLVNYGQLNGTPIDWSAYRTEGIISVALWIAIAAGCIVAYHKAGYAKFMKAATVVSICIILVQAVTIGSLMITKDGMKRESLVCTMDSGEFDYSSKDNFIILLFDAFDSNSLTRILEEDSTDSYAETLEDFTFYPNTIGGYSSTDLAIPYILTGEKYLNKEPYGEYLEEAYQKAPFINELNDRGWFTGIYTDITPPKGEAAKKIDNVLNSEIEVSSHKKLAVYMYKLVGFRYLPQPLKKYCWFYSDDMLDLRYIENFEANGIYNWSNRIFYDKMDEINTDAEKNTFHFYHLEGTHGPYTMERNLKINKDGTSLDEEGRGVLFLLDSYIQELKEEGIYDDAVIIVMADHGTEELQQCPTLLVKGKGEKHKFVSSQAAVSYADLQEAYSRLLNGKKGKEVFDVNGEAGEKRNRKFYRYTYKGDLQTGDYSNVITEYATSDNATNFDSLKETGVVYKGKED